MTAAVGSAAQAAPLVDESFAYPDGTNLVGQDPPVGGAWAAISGAGATPIQVTGGKASVAQGGGSREDAAVQFEGGAAAAAGSVLYSSFDLSVADPGAAITAVYFAGFAEGTSLFDARIWIAPPTGATGYRLAISNDNSISDGDGEVFTTDLSFGTTYKVVTSYDYTAADAVLWIDPTSQSSASISPSDPGFSDEVNTYFLRQAAGNTTQVVDNLKVGTAFSDVAIPEPTSLGLLGVAGLAIAARRRRAN